MGRLYRGFKIAQHFDIQLSLLEIRLLIEKPRAASEEKCGTRTTELKGEMFDLTSVILKLRLITFSGGPFFFMGEGGYKIWPAQCFSPVINEAIIIFQSKRGAFSSMNPPWL